MKQLAGADFRDRWHAGYMLGTLGPAAAPALPMLHKVLEKKSEHEYVRGMAAWAIGRIGPGAEGEIPLLSETMHSRGHLAVRRASVESLGNFGAAAKPVVPELVKLLARRRRDHARQHGGRLVEDRPPPEGRAGAGGNAAARHRPASGDLEPYLAAVALGQMEADDDPASWVPAVAPALIAALHDADGDVRRAAVALAGRAWQGSVPCARQGESAGGPGPRSPAAGDRVAQLHGRGGRSAADGRAGGR